MDYMLAISVVKIYLTGNILLLCDTISISLTLMSCSQT